MGTFLLPGAGLVVRRARLTPAEFLSMAVPHRTCATDPYAQSTLIIVCASPDRAWPVRPTQRSVQKPLFWGWSCTRRREEEEEEAVIDNVGMVITKTDAKLRHRSDRA